MGAVAAADPVNFHNVCHTVPPLMFSGQPADRKGAAVRLGTEAAGCSHEMATAWTLGGGDLHVVTHRVGAVCEGAVLPGDNARGSGATG